MLQPLRYAAVGDRELTNALATWDAASVTQRQTWLDAYTGALDKAQEQNGHIVVTSGDYGPVATLVDDLLQIARSGALDGLLLSSSRFYQTDFTRPLLFMDDGGRISDLAKDEHLVGDQWGMMNETGQYPGQTWLWLYTMWYQVFPFNSTTGVIGLSAANADLGIIILMTLLTVVLALVPLIPILRDIPRWVPIHRLIWREYYAAPKATRASA